jgi:iron only hydrogenase large subunit-like protein
MNNLNPVYTERTECQDCYKCVRECPVKAIKIQNSAAAVIPELCILCGHCVDVCPAGAKRVRDDLEKVKQLIIDKKKVYVSLAPSFTSEFPGIKPGQLISALKKLGFHGVSETALGAQQVSAHVAHQLGLKTGKIVISSACPAVSDYIIRYLPGFTQSMTQLLSPMLTHSKMLRKRYGNDIGIVFIGPCIAKKREADSHPQLIDCALTYDDLQRWFELEKIDPAGITSGETDVFVPHTAEEGALYPIDGGMSATLKANCTVHDACFMSFSGIKNIRKALEGLEKVEINGNIFIEALSCEGGCINGPGSTGTSATAAKRYSVVNYASYPRKKIPRSPTIPINEFATDTPVENRIYNEESICGALRQVGKIKKEDELNCGGCGYDSCRDFAAALLSGKAERTMCVTYMRILAQNKASGLLRTMPSGVVIVNEKLEIIESNRNFARLFGPEMEKIFETNPGLEGASLKKILSFHELFRHVLDTGEDLVNRDIRVNERILHGSIFTIEPHSVVGGVIADITAPSIQKEQVIHRAQDIIKKNLTMVQKIAYLLGENASESEAVLNSIIESFSLKPLEKLTDSPETQSS